MFSYQEGGRGSAGCGGRVDHLGDLDSHGGQGGGVLQNDGGVVVYGIHHLISRPARQLRLAVIHLPQAHSDFLSTRFLPRGKVRPADKLQIKATTILPLIGLARSKTHSDVGAVLSSYTAPCQPGGHSKHPPIKQTVASLCQQVPVSVG